MPPARASRAPVVTMLPSGDNSTDLSFISSEMASYRKKTGVRVNSLAAYDSVDTRLMLLHDVFGKKSSEPDICGIDNIWPGLLAEDLIDLKPLLGDELTTIDKSLLDAFTVDGRLVALPEDMDTAVLYYRTDLLRNMGTNGRRKLGTNWEIWRRSSRRASEKRESPISGDIFGKEPKVNR